MKAALSRRVKGMLLLSNGGEMPPRPITWPGFITESNDWKTWIGPASGRKYWARRREPEGPGWQHFQELQFSAESTATIGLLLVLEDESVIDPALDGLGELAAILVWVNDTPVGSFGQEPASRYHDVGELPDLGLQAEVGVLVDDLDIVLREGQREWSRRLAEQEIDLDSLLHEPSWEHPLRLDLSWPGHFASGVEGVVSSLHGSGGGVVWRGPASGQEYEVNSVSADAGIALAFRPLRNDRELEVELWMPERPRTLANPWAVGLSCWMLVWEDGSPVTEDPSAGQGAYRRLAEISDSSVRNELRGFVSDIALQSIKRRAALDEDLQRHSRKARRRWESSNLRLEEAPSDTRSTPGPAASDVSRREDFVAQFVALLAYYDPENTRHLTERTAGEVLRDFERSLDSPSVERALLPSLPNWVSNCLEWTDDSRWIGSVEPRGRYPMSIGVRPSGRIFEPPSALVVRRVD